MTDSAGESCGAGEGVEEDALIALGFLGFEAGDFAFAGLLKPKPDKKHIRVKAPQ